MGNCCKLPKNNNKEEDKKTKPKKVQKSSDYVVMLTDEKSKHSKILHINCDFPSINMTIHYREAIPIQDIKEQIVFQYPDFSIENYSLFRDSLEILDATATLKQLGIDQGDTLTLKLIQELDESEDLIASENNSIPEMKEEIVTGNVSSVKPKKGLAARSAQESNLTSPKKAAQELWRTALPSPQARPLIKCDPLDASSLTNNTHDHSLKPLNGAFQVKIPGNPMYSDDSNLEERKINRERENLGYFKDLHGPFFMFEKE